MMAALKESSVDILHPLSELSSTGWVDCRDSPHIDNDAQPVLLGDSVYTKGRSDNKATAWKYYIPTKSWSQLSSPQVVEADNYYVLAVYRSRLVWIGGKLRIRNSQKDEVNKKVFVLEQGKGWKEDTSFVLPLPDDVSLSLNLSAAGDDKFLVVGSRSKLVIFDGQQWKQRDGLECDKGSILVQNGTLYLIAKENYQSSFSKAPLQSLLIKKEYDMSIWKTLKIPNERSSLTVVGGHITIAARASSYTLCVLGFSSNSDSWLELTEIELKSQFRTTPHIIGLPNQSLLLMGMIKVGLGDTWFPEFGMIEVTTNVLPYNPENKISVAAVLKLDLYAGIKVLTRLGTQLDNFKERAGFTISYHKPLPMSELYEESSTVKCIKSWVDDETSSIPPTWNNFFQILREPTMNLSDIADDIDRYLESTAQKEQSEQKRDTTGLEDIAVLRSDLDSLYEKVTTVQEEEIQGLAHRVHICLEKCRLIFDKVGKEVEDYKRSTKQLKEERDHLLKEHQRLNDIIEQGQSSAKHRHVDEADDTQIPKLKNLLKELYKKVADKWEDIGIMLDIEEGSLNRIKSDNAGNSGSCLREMLKFWLKKVTPKPTWSSMADALEVLGEESLAEHVRKNYVSIS